jgi:hypothetical protein
MITDSQVLDCMRHSVLFLNVPTIREVDDSKDKYACI